MKNEPLKFPSGEFTHAELAEFNGITKPQAWIPYQEAVKNRTIILVGKRSTGGRGKPSLLWKLADPNQVTATSVAINPPPIEKITVIVHEVENKEQMEKILVAAEPIPVSVETPAEVISKSVAEPVLLTDEAKITDYKCPVCSTKLLSKRDIAGVMVWCNQPKTVCNVSENPFGHGKNENAAHETLCEKWKFALDRK